MVTGVHYISTSRWSSPWPSLTLKTNTAFIALLPLSHHHPPHTFLTTACGLSPLCRGAYPLLKSHQHSFPTVMLSAPIFAYPVLHPKLGPSSSRLCPEHQKVLDGLDRTQGSQGVRPLPPRKWRPALSTMQMHFPVGNKGPEAASFLSSIWPWGRRGLGQRRVLLGREVVQRLLWGEVSCVLRCGLELPRPREPGKRTPSSALKTGGEGHPQGQDCLQRRKNWMPGQVW